MKRTRLDGLLAKIETVYATDSVPVVGTDGIQLDEHIWGSIETDFLERNSRENATGTAMGRHGGGQPTGRWAKITVTAALKGAGAVYAAGVRPEIDVLLRASALQGVLTAGAGSEKWDYTPRSDAHESATLYAYAAGSLFKIVGCRGKVSISTISAKIGLIKIELMGLLVDNPTDIALPSITYPRRAVKPPVAASAALTLNGFGPAWKSLDFEMKTDIQPRPRGNAAGGHAGYEVLDYEPGFTVMIDSPDKSAFDAWALEAAGTEFAWSLNVGGTQYNRWKLTGPAGRVVRVPPQADGGFAMLNLGIQALNGAATPPFTLTFD